MNRISILKQAISTYGVPVQEDICIEEMYELTKAILKLRREDDICKNGATGSALKSNILEEIADVQIMLDQMRIIYGDTSDWEEYKINRLMERMERESRE